MKDNQASQEKRIKFCLMKMGVDPTHIGYYQLMDSIKERIIATDNNICKIYSIVADKYGIRPKTVMRNISYALTKVHDLPKKMSELMGFQLDANALHFGSIIFYLAELIKDPSLFKPDDDDDDGDDD